MTKKISYSTCLFLITLILTGFSFQMLNAQSSGVEITGTVSESGTGLPLDQVAVSVSSTGTTAITDEQGTFTLTVPDLQAEINVSLPGYNRRNIYLNGRESLDIVMVSDRYQTMDNVYNTPLGTQLLKDATFPVTSVTQSAMAYSKASSFDQALQGKVPGMMFTEQSGMPYLHEYPGLLFPLRQYRAPAVYRWHDTQLLLCSKQSHGRLFTKSHGCG